MLVIGYGNELRGDDGAGRLAARLLAKRLGLRPARFAAVLSVQQLMPELAEPISRARAVVFIDADRRLPPGKVQRTPLAAGGVAGGAIGHHQNPQGLLGLARALYGRAPRAWLIGLGGSNFGYCARLSPPARRAVYSAVQHILRSERALSGPQRRAAAAIMAGSIGERRSTSSAHDSP